MLQNTRAFRASSGIIPGSSCYPPSGAERGCSTLQAPSSQKIPGWGAASHPPASGSGRGCIPHQAPTKYNFLYFFTQNTLSHEKKKKSLKYHEGVWDFSKPPEELTLPLEESCVIQQVQLLEVSK